MRKKGVVRRGEREREGGRDGGREGEAGRERERGGEGGGKTRRERMGEDGRGTDQQGKGSGWAGPAHASAELGLESSDWTGPVTGPDGPDGAGLASQRLCSHEG